MHSVYRANSGAVDLFNRKATQPGTLPDVWQTPNCFHRLLAATLAFCETNAHQAYNARNVMGKYLSQRDWYLALAEALINNPFRVVSPERGLVVSGHAMDPRGGQWGQSREGV